MDIEQLRLVLETVNAVGGDAKSVAIWWLVGGFVVQVLGIAVAYLVAILGYRFATKYFAQDASLREIGKAAGYRCMGPWGEWDTAQTVEHISRLKLTGLLARPKEPVPPAP